MWIERERVCVVNHDELICYEMITKTRERERVYKDAADKRHKMKT